MIASGAELKQAIIKHQRPLIFGSIGLLVVVGLIWLDSAISNSQFTEVFVEAPSNTATSETPTVTAPSTEEQLAAVRGEAQALLEQERELAQQTTDSRAATRTEIEALLDRWVTAWASKDIGTYLSFYSEDFDTPFDISFEEWAGSRIRRIESPRWIRVQLEQIDFILVQDDSVAISVTQLYATPGYADRTRKHIDLAREERGWKIVREDSVETVRLDQQ